MMRIRRLIFAPIAVLSILVGCLLFASAPALARTETGPFEAGTFANPESIAIEQATGDVYVYDHSAGDLYKFNADMVPEDFTFTGSNKIAVGFGGARGHSQVAVDNSNGPAKGDIYVAIGAEVKIYNSAGEALSPLQEIEGVEEGAAGVAVDSSGAVYVSFAGSGNINEYIPGANPVTKADYSCTLDVKLFTNVNVAVDSAGIYTAAASGTSEGKITKYKASQCSTSGITQSGEIVDTPGPSATPTLTIDPENEDVYVNTTSNILVFNSSNTKIEEFGSGSLTGSSGIGVSDASGHEGDVYVPDREEPSEEEAEEIEEGVEGVGPGILIFASASAPEEFLLKVEKEGTGAAEGKVTSSPSGITCGIEAGCEAKFKEDETVTLTATEEGATFTKWTGCKSVPTPTTCEVEMTEAKTVKAEFTAVASTKFPLNVYITGNGKVNGGPIVECTSAGGSACEGQAENTVTLTATPGTGYVLAGWIGCKKTTATECTVDMSQAREVTAVFLLEGTKGTNGTNGTDGEGLSAKAFPGNENGCAEGGIEIEQTTSHAKTYVCNGVKGSAGPAGGEGKQGLQGFPGEQGISGAAGEKGANGANGAAGAQGPAGPAGLAGPAGKEGPAGKVQVVTCTKSGKKKKCTTKIVSGTVKFTTSSARATLSRYGIVYAAGAARATKRGISLRLLSVRKLKPGRYTLTLTSGSGRNETIHSETFTLR